METILTRTLEDYIAERKNELYQRVMGLRIDESQTQQLRGQFDELKRLEKRMKEHFANPKEGRNE